MKKEINRKEKIEEKVVEKKQISMAADVATRNLNHIVKELKVYVNEETVLKLTKEQIQMKIAALFKKYPTTKNVEFNNDWYGYQLMLALNLAERVEKDKFVRDHILDLERILPSFHEFKGLKKDLANKVYRKEKVVEEPKKVKKVKTKEELNHEIVEFGMLQRKKTVARKNSGKVPRRMKR